MCFIFFAVFLRAQDERLVRDFLSGALHEEKPVSVPEVSFKARTGRYRFDLNRDGKPESFYFSKWDGQDWLTVYDHKERAVFRHYFEAAGPLSRAYKWEVRDLSSKTRLFLIHFFEGRTDYLKLRGSARLYFLTMDDNDLKTLRMFKGPLVWDEYDDRRGHYHQRARVVSLVDLNRDRVFEVVVQHHLVARVFQYFGGGQWRSP